MVFQKGHKHNKGKRGRKKGAAVVAKAVPVMRPLEAGKIAAKNSRTIVKISQLLEIHNMPGAQLVDTEGLVLKRIEKLKSRLNRRLAKLARWSDIAIEDRMAWTNEPKYVQQMQQQQHMSAQQQSMAPKRGDASKNSSSSGAPAVAAADTDANSKSYSASGSTRKTPAVKFSAEGGGGSAVDLGTAQATAISSSTTTTNADGKVVNSTYVYSSAAAVSAPATSSSSSSSAPGHYSMGGVSLN